MFTAFTSTVKVKLRPKVLEGMPGTAVVTTPYGEAASFTLVFHQRGSGSDGRRRSKKAIGCAVAKNDMSNTDNEDTLQQRAVARHMFQKLRTVRVEVGWRSWE